MSQSASVGHHHELAESYTLAILPVRMSGNVSAFDRLKEASHSQRAFARMAHIRIGATAARAPVRAAARPAAPIRASYGVGHRTFHFRITSYEAPPARIASHRQLRSQTARPSSAPAEKPMRSKSVDLTGKVTHATCISSLSLLLTPRAVCLIRAGIIASGYAYCRITFSGSWKGQTCGSMGFCSVNHRISER